MFRNISILMMATFSGGGRDEFGRDDAGTRRPLLLDTVMQGRKRESHCRLLQMPAEILGDIVDLLADDKPALASLALVNSDCRYLARFCQFAEIQFDYSHQAHQLLGGLFRDFTYAPRPEYVRGFHLEAYDAAFGRTAGSYSVEEKRELLRLASAHYTELRGIMLSAISNSELPNLEVLTWEDPFTVDANFFEEISRCSAHHIKLVRVKADRSCRMRPHLTPAVWPLRSLDLDVQLDYSSRDELDEPDDTQDGVSARELDHPLSHLFKTLLRLCAPTLESLNWEHSPSPFRGRTMISLGSDPLAFPNLRYLRLGCDLHPPTFSSLISSPLRHLELPISFSHLAKCLTTCEPMRDLESVVISMLPRDIRPCLHVAEFLKQHKHIHKLVVHENDFGEGDSQHLDRLIMPILAKGGFDNLCCLSLAWGGEGAGDVTNPPAVHIPETALMILGTIASLERLYLRAGCSFGWKHQWLVDHDQLRHHLKGLSRLKMLALVRDTYAISPLDNNTARYYSLRWVEDEEYVDAQARPHLDADAHDMVDDEMDYDDVTKAMIETWEKAHRNRMLTQAEAYARVFPALEWIYCGQWPMGFERNFESRDAQSEAIALTERRDDCSTFLHKTFGICQE
ncbi:hypothetical protein TARUN_4179 [Trichoderma arundinaceum]|uniref:Uncharacterized protein n=1 Tax=Trichoderma arundinaceum TaxID=490622 RepID=A0A395NPX1_TRIAR|nr:hypothetical protein TARUN_4179 [Trichoderma arundinaceum]